MEKLLLFMRNDKTKNEITRMRDYAMWLVLQYCWLRVSELCSLKVYDIEEKIQILWKWQRTRLVYLHTDYIKVIQLYLFLRRKLHINSEYVFVSHAHNTKWHPLSRASVEKIFRDASGRAWVEKTRPHKIRHTFATTLLDKWWDLIYISKLLWHKNITTTQTYLDISNNKIKEIQQLIPTI
jgi:integrase/recombinase XerD